jgi:hypothetical protein
LLAHLLVTYLLLQEVVLVVAHQTEQVVEVVQVGIVQAQRNPSHLVLHIPSQ